MLSKMKALTGGKLKSRLRLLEYNACETIASRLMGRC